MSAWQAHLTAFRGSHPSLSMKECMQQASKTYSASATSFRGGAKKNKVAKKKPVGGSCGGGNSWMQHVAAYRAKHGCSYGEALKGASNTYVKKTC